MLARLLVQSARCRRTQRSSPPAPSRAHSSVIGDRWTLLILRDAFQGAHRFEEFRNLSGAARSTLTSRLNGLVENGLLERVRYSDAPPRFEYRLTAMGLALYGVTLVTWRWEHHWAPSGAGIPRYLRHNVCKHAMQPETMCSGCGKVVEVRDTGYEVVAATGRSRSATPRFRRLSSVNAESHRGASTAFVHITDILGDRWTPLVLCTAFLGLRRFDEIQSGLEIATNILTHRLNYLVDHKHPRAPAVLRAAAALRVSAHAERPRPVSACADADAVGRSLAQPVRRPEPARVPQALRRAAQRGRGLQSLPQDDRSARRHLPAGARARPLRAAAPPRASGIVH